MRAGLMLPDCLHITAAVSLTDAEMPVEGTFLPESTPVEILISGGLVTQTGETAPNIAVWKPNGDLLLVYRRDCLPVELCQLGYEVFRKVDAITLNRGAAAGLVDPPRAVHLVAHSGLGRATQLRFRPLKQDGSISKRNYAMPMPSGIAGFYPRTPSMPYCRLTRFTREHLSEFRRALPFIRFVDGAFREALPLRYEAQAKLVSQAPDFTIPGSVFTTITINKTFATAVHHDSGDYAEGFESSPSCRWSVFRRIPRVSKYQVGVDLRTGGVLLADVHELTGTPPLSACRASTRG